MNVCIIREERLCTDSQKAEHERVNAQKKSIPKLSIIYEHMLGSPTCAEKGQCKSQAFQCHHRHLIEGGKNLWCQTHNVRNKYHEWLVVSAQQSYIPAKDLTGTMDLHHFCDPYQCWLRFATRERERGCS